MCKWANSVDHKPGLSFCTPYGQQSIQECEMRGTTLATYRVHWWVTGLYFLLSRSCCCDCCYCYCCYTACCACDSTGGDTETGTDTPVINIDIHSLHLHVPHVMDPVHELKSDAPTRPLFWDENCSGALPVTESEGNRWAYFSAVVIPTLIAAKSIAPIKRNNK